jgi:hypothetical protein
LIKALMRFHPKTSRVLVCGLPKTNQDGKGLSLTAPGVMAGVACVKQARLKDGWFFAGGIGYTDDSCQSLG